MADLGDGGHVEYFEAGIAKNLAEQEPGLVADGCGESVGRTGIDERGFDAETRQRVFQEIVRTAVQGTRGDDMIARGQDRGDC